MHLDGQLVLPDRVLPGRVRFDTRITAIEPRADAPARYILPGFIDTHVHGGGGGDTMDGVDAIERLARFHLAHGTTTLLPTTITRPWPEVIAALRAVAEVSARGIADGPRIPGAHLEGPFLSPHRLGAQPPFTLPPEPRLVAEALATGCVRVVTLAPELDHADSAIDAFAAAGVRVSLGHSTADFDTATAAICRICAAGGVAGGTHLFNAMGGIEGRRPGLAGALICHGEAHAELILDGFHVHPGSFRLAARAMGDRLLFVTDAMRGTGLGDGPSELGGHPVTITKGRALLADGTLAGSVLTLDQAVRNALAQGSSIVEAAKLASSNAADYLGLDDRGRIETGRLADLVVLDETFAVREVHVGGARRVAR